MSNTDRLAYRARVLPTQLERARVLPTQLERARRRYEALCREAREYGFHDLLEEGERA